MRTAAALPPVTANGRTRYEFDYRHGPYDRIESGAVGYATYGDRLVVSTLPDYAAFAARYRNAAVDPGADDPAVAQLARTLTAGVADPHDQARILYDWVQANIRYVGLFRRNGRRPASRHRHPAQPLRRLQGSCRAVRRAARGGRHPQRAGAAQSRVRLHAAVGARLRRRGDQSRDHVAARSRALCGHDDGRHRIRLSAADRDGPSRAAGRHGRAVAYAGHAAARRIARVEIDAGPGAARFHAHTEDDGWTAELERNLFRRATPDSVAQLANNRLRQSGLRGRAQLSTSDRRVTDGPFDVTMSGTLDHFVARRHDRVARAVEPDGRHRDAGRELARRPWHAAVGLHRRDVRRDRPDRAAGRRRGDRPAGRYGRARPLRRLHVALRLRRGRARRAGHAAHDGGLWPSGVYGGRPALRASLERIERDTQAQIVVRAKGR